VKARHLFAVVLLMISGVVSAQTACPQGVAAGGAQCGPSSLINPDDSGDPGANGGRPSSPIKWADSWGAIASDGGGNFGIVTDFPSKRKAKKAAIGECRLRGGTTCEVRRVFVNQCAAVIAGNGATATANAPTIEEAVKIGMPICVENGATDCHVYYSGCSLAWRTQ
jgi:hypothetical protein